MKKINYIVILFVIWSFSVCAQWAPSSGFDKGIPADSAIIKAWAVNCEVTRGLQDISDPSLGYASAGSISNALGAAGANGPISLGDGGSAILTFGQPLMNGPGADFAVFEYTFNYTFLELAFVAVSSDGVNFVTFPARSNSQDTLQYANDAEMDPSKIYNLAGKHGILMGTPFDLEELKETEGLDINHITHVQVTDVVGSLLPDFATYDKNGHVINDPWPTPFPTSGFDLDAVGVIHQNLTALGGKENEGAILVYPNPASGYLYFQHDNKLIDGNLESVTIKDLKGQVMLSLPEPDRTMTSLSLHGLMPGLYYVQLNRNGRTFTQKITIL